MNYKQQISCVLLIFICSTSFAQNLNLTYNSQHNSQQKAIIEDAGKIKLDSLNAERKQIAATEKLAIGKNATAYKRILLANHDTGLAANVQTAIDAFNITSEPSDVSMDFPNTLTQLKRMGIAEKDPGKVKIISDLIDSIKLNNSLDFLSSTKLRIKPFSIFNIGMYNIDTVNDYLYAQNQIDVFQSAGFQYYGSTTTYIKTEFLSFLFGPMRLGIVGSFKSSGDTSKDNQQSVNLQKVLNNGGALNFSLPVLFCRDKSEQVHFGVFAQNNLSFTPLNPENLSSNLLFSGQSGLVFHLDLGSNPDPDANQIARLSFDIPMYYCYGSPDTYKQLNQADFSVMQMRFGLVIKDQFTFSVSGTLLSNNKSVQNTGWVYCMKFSPSQLLSGSN